MEIYIADYLGFCGGVSRAVKLTEDLLEDHDDVYIEGMLIHNEDEVKRLEGLGLKDFDLNINKDSKLILRTHGTDINIKNRLAKNYKIYDTVCPYVEKVQKLAEKYKDDNLIIFGKKGHAEVVGINSHSDNQAIIIETIDDLTSFIDGHSNSDKLTIICQTTFKKTLADQFLIILEENNFHYDYHETICDATRKRSQATIDLAKNVDAMIVLGDKASSNCTKLYEYAKQYCKDVFFINSINEMDISQLIVYNKIGVTAGASTPDWIIKEAIEKMEDMNQNEMMEAIESSFTNIKRGDILTGTVLYANDEEVTVNINYSADGIIPKEEVSDDPTVDPSDLFNSGDEIEVYVQNMDDGDGNVLLSHKRVEKLKVWDEIEQLYKEGAIVEVYVTEVTKGGLRVDIKGISGFMPASHVAIRYVKDLSVFLDQVLDSKIIDFNKHKKRLIVSRKEVEQEEVERKKAELYDSLNEGDIIDGTVQRLTDFGAFVDIGGMDGLVHISELSWDRVRHPSDIVSPGEEIQVKVIDIDQERDRVALSLKQLAAEPWDVFVENNKVGDIVKGNVVNLLDFGAFIKLESGVDGLLHVSQIAREHVDKPSDRLEMGQEVEVLITDIDEEKRNISLSIKEIEVREARAKRQEERKEQEEQAPVAKKPRKKPRSKDDRAQQSSEPSFGVNLGDLLNLEVDSEEDSEDDSNVEIEQASIQEDSNLNEESDLDEQDSDHDQNEVDQESEETDENKSDSDLIDDVEEDSTVDQGEDEPIIDQTEEVSDTEETNDD